MASVTLSFHEIWLFVVCFMNVNFIYINYEVKYKWCICMCCGSLISLLFTSELQWKALFFILSSLHICDCQFQTYEDSCIFNLKRSGAILQSCYTNKKLYTLCWCTTQESNLSFMKWNKQFKRNLCIHHYSGNCSFSTWWNSIVDILTA
jgi:hypothetical protein